VAADGREIPVESHRLTAAAALHRYAASPWWGNTWRLSTRTPHEALL